MKWLRRTYYKSYSPVLETLLNPHQKNPVPILLELMGEDLRGDSGTVTFIFPR